MIKLLKVVIHIHIYEKMLTIYIHLMKNIISNLHANLLLFVYSTMLCIQ